MAPKRASKKAAAPPPPLPPPAETRSDESEDDDASAATPAVKTAPVRAATPAVKTAPVPSHKDGEEDSSSSSSEEEEADDDEEKEEEPVRKKQPPPPSGSDDDEEEDSSEEEEGSSEEEDSSEEKEEEPVRKKQPPPPSGSDDEEEEPVHKKKQPPPPQDKELEAPAPPQKPAPKKAAAFQRVWPTDDEVRILEILAAHRKEHGSRPKPKSLFGIFAGKLNNPDYSSKELEDKVKNTGTKYKELIKKGEVPRNEHDRQTLELAKLVYGGDGHESKSFEEMCVLYPYLAEVVKQLEAKYPTSFKRKFGKMEDDKARAMDDKFKRHRAEQIKMDMRLSDLTKQATKALVDILE